MTRLEARAAGIRMRLTEIAAEQGVLRKLSHGLAQVPGQSVADPDQRASRYSQAARQIYEIADIEHAETARLILEGPMQRARRRGTRSRVDRPEPRPRTRDRGRGEHTLPDRRR